MRNSGLIPLRCTNCRKASSMCIMTMRRTSLRRRLIWRARSSHSFPDGRAMQARLAGVVRNYLEAAPAMHRVWILITMQLPNLTYHQLTARWLKWWWMALATVSTAPKPSSTPRFLNPTHHSSPRPKMLKSQVCHSPNKEVNHHCLQKARGVILDLKKRLLSLF